MDHHPHQQLSDLLHPEPYTCCKEAPGKGFACCPKCRLGSNDSFPLKGKSTWKQVCLVPGVGRMQNPLNLVFLSGVRSCFCLREGTVWFRQPINRRSGCDTATKDGLLRFLSEVNFRCIIEVTSVYLLRKGKL